MAAPRIVCIGEQTTLTTEMKPTWPVQMQMDLGAAYTVTDDGDGSGTVLAGSKGGTRTFTTPTNPPFQDSIMAPDIVVIGPWAEHDEIAVEAGADATHFQADYDALVTVYLGLPKKPCVIVTTPVVISTYQKNPATDQLVMNTIEPAVLAVATAHSLPVVDLYTAFMGQSAWLGADGHFSDAGAVQVAKLVELALPSCTGGGGTGAGGASGTAGGAGANGGASAAGNGSGGSAGAVASAGAAGGVNAAAGGTQSGAAGNGTVSAGGSAATASGGSAGTTSTESSPSSSQSSGCAISTRSTTSSRAPLLVLFGGALLLGTSRRRRLARRRSRPAA